MTIHDPRYDSIAEWYVEFTSAWGPEPVAPLPDDLVGQRVVDLACGYGVASRYLASRGADVTAIDLSREMIAQARAHEAGHPAGVEYLVGDATTLEWWDRRPVDGALSNMALMDIDDLDGALSVASRIVRPGGWLSFAIFHPCYPGAAEGSVSGLPSWPPDEGYRSERWWTTEGEGIRGRVGANHRMLATYLNAVLRAGFDFENFVERASTVPVHLAALCRRRAG